MTDKTLEELMSEINSTKIDEGLTNAAKCLEAFEIRDIINQQQETIDRQKAEIEKCINIICKKEDTEQLIARERQQYYDELQQAKAKIEALQMDNKQLQSDIVNANMNCEHIANLYETAKAEIEKLIEEKQQITEKFNCQQTVYADLSKIIKDKNAEIEALIEGQETLQKNLAKTIKAEAVREFAERLKAVSHPYADTQMVFELQIDNLVKEMAGDNNA